MCQPFDNYNLLSPTKKDENWIIALFPCTPVLLCRCMWKNAKTKKEAHMTSWLWFGISTLFTVGKCPLLQPCLSLVQAIKQWAGLCNLLRAACAVALLYMVNLMDNAYSFTM